MMLHSAVIERAGTRALKAWRDCVEFRSMAYILPLIILSALLCVLNLRSSDRGTASVDALSSVECDVYQNLFLYWGLFEALDQLRLALLPVD